MKILFLCSSNIHRSITAEDYFQSISSNFEFKSAGVSEYTAKNIAVRCVQLSFKSGLIRFFYGTNALRKNN